MWSEIAMTRSMWWSISRMVRPMPLSLTIRSVSWSVSAGFRPAAGSSSSSRSGMAATARAISSRRCKP
ncbi:hypothetical protein G6F64_015566 [Rhizopus arrhizus]|uniref:Uncharacterized protein n=1 Tax=Rhizopus oryzae TaxID=64495 RepID=A0A9P6WR14_RHIOR|nr:hypothetical protein G6F64_015566 [Rhizopus arrhizus]